MSTLLVQFLALQLDRQFGMGTLCSPPPVTKAMLSPCLVALSPTACVLLPGLLLVMKAFRMNTSVLGAIDCSPSMGCTAA